MRILIFWGPVAAWMGLIFYFSSQTSVKVSDVFAIQFLVFKSLHILEYGLLYLLVYRALCNTRKAYVWQDRIDAFLIAFFYGISDEVHQVFVPTREGRIRDIVIDALGISLASITLWKYLPKAPKKLKSWAKKLQLI